MYLKRKEMGNLIVTLSLLDSKRKGMGNLIVDINSEIIKYSR